MSAAGMYTVSHCHVDCQLVNKHIVDEFDNAGVKEYSTAIDMWSLGCIMGELIQNKPLLPGKSEMEQIHKIFSLVGTPTAENWPKHTDLPNLNKVSMPLCLFVLLESLLCAMWAQ